MSRCHVILQILKHNPKLVAMAVATAAIALYPEAKIQIDKHADVKHNNSESLNLIRALKLLDSKNRMPINGDFESFLKNPLVEMKKFISIGELNTPSNPTPIRFSGPDMERSLGLPPNTLPTNALTARNLKDPFGNYRTTYGVPKNFAPRDMQYMGLWVGSDLKKFSNLLGVEFTPPVEVPKNKMLFVWHISNGWWGGQSGLMNNAFWYGNRGGSLGTYLFVHVDKETGKTEKVELVSFHKTTRILHTYSDSKDHILLGPKTEKKVFFSEPYSPNSPKFYVDPSLPSVPKPAPETQDGY